MAGRKARFGPAGQQLWDGLLKQGVFSPAEEVLVVEACRIADRLDKLADMLDGGVDSWISLVVDGVDEQVVSVVIDKPLGEARQQALALKQLVTELRQLRGVAAPADSGGDGADELAARRAARIAAAAGS